ncbi:MAG: NAD(P)/FAD-dependent oxidoreductase [Pirellulales bacterium]|nr:NAD(P)/FAD-dependent oxidoreductase [Pirellulales bacterium]
MFPNKKHIHDVIIVGAGAAGIGLGVILRELRIANFLILERYQVGGSFLRWPREMRLITPSFPSNSIGMLDLNSIAIGTSPGYSLGTEHSTGKEYAAYLQAVASHFQQPVKLGVEVRGIEKSDKPGVWIIKTNSGAFATRHLVWAAGEFQYPRETPFPGSEHCLHTSRVTAWSSYPVEDAVIIGGYESGMDAVINLLTTGKKVRLFERQARPDVSSSDPSQSLSPYTLDRLSALNRQKSWEWISGVDICNVVRHDKSFMLTDSQGYKYRAKHAPLLATGFECSAKLVSEHFAWRQDRYPELTKDDESTLSSNLFLVGPGVRHDNHIFCFIYKYRQRFAVVASAIAHRLGHDTQPLENYRKWGMYLDDLSCCGQDCLC